MIKEFKDFINKGNFLELAVGFVLGAAFTSVVTSLTDRIINPAIGLLFDLSSLDQVWTFTDDGTGSFGALISSVINFLLVGLVLFFVVRAYNSMRSREEAEQPEPGPAEDVVLLREIRDALTSN